MKYFTLVFALIAGLALATPSTQDSESRPRVRDLRRAGPPQLLQSLEWMAGSWYQAEGGVEMEELWMAPKGGLMLGLHRDVRPDAGRTSFEYLRIEARADGVFYVASPGGHGGTEFRLMESTGGRVVFENPEHDFPSRILYWLDDVDVLWAKIEGRLGGTVQTRQWAFGRRGSSPESIPERATEGESRPAEGTEKPAGQ